MPRGATQGSCRAGREADGARRTHGRGFCAEERVRQGERAWGWLSKFRGLWAQGRTPAIWRLALE